MLCSPPGISVSGGFGFPFTACRFLLPKDKNPLEDREREENEELPLRAFASNGLAMVLPAGAVDVEGDGIPFVLR